MMTVSYTTQTNVVVILYLYMTHILSFYPVAVVGLERTFYQVPEDVGVVEVCAVVYSPNITCPIEFSFAVGLSTIGIYIH